MLFLAEIEILFIFYWGCCTVATTRSPERRGVHVHYCGCGLKAAERCEKQRPPSELIRAKTQSFNYVVSWFIRILPGKQIEVIRSASLGGNSKVKKTTKNPRIPLWPPEPRRSLPAAVCWCEVTFWGNLSPFFPRRDLKASRTSHVEPPCATGNLNALILSRHTSVCT